MSHSNIMVTGCAISQALEGLAILAGTTEPEEFRQAVEHLEAAEALLQKGAQSLKSDYNPDLDLLMVDGSKSWRSTTVQ